MPATDFSSDTLLVLYLHGFLSSPQSKKAQQVIEYCDSLGIGQCLCVPELDNAPKNTITALTELLQRHPQKHRVLIGSSLGGYYATYLAEEFGFLAALINPAVEPFRFWETHIGRHRNYYEDEMHTVTAEHILELKSLDKPVLKKPQNYLLLAQKGDETLDYRQAVTKYQDGHCVIQDGGNHSFENFESMLPIVFDFLLPKHSQLPS